jgi:TIGR03009 family protein
MRLSGLALVASLALAAASVAQDAPPRLSSSPAPPAAAPTPADPVLDGVLRRWEQEMQRFQTLALKLSRIDEDKTLHIVTKYTGFAYFMKTGSGPTARNLVLLQTSREGSNEIAEKFVCTGTFFYLFNPSTKEIQARELPRGGPGAMADDNVLGMFGVRAEEARRRYNLKLTKQDDYYIYIEIVPRFRRDQEEFKWARIVLDKRNFLPRQLQYLQPNNDQVVWDFPDKDVQVNVKMDQRWFDRPETPKGWKFVTIRPDADAPPKIYRNSGTP